MSILLIVEVMDWAPVTLTHREHKVLMILAEDCRDETRETWRPIDSPDALRRARLSRTQMYAVLDALIKKGCLERSVAGGFGHRAKYRIPHLAGLHSVPESGTQDESAVSRKVGHSSVPENDEQSPGKRDALCPGKWDAYPSDPSDPPELPPVKAELRNGGTGSSEPSEGQDRDNGKPDKYKLAARQAIESRRAREAEAAAP